MRDRRESRAGWDLVLGVVAICLLVLAPMAQAAGSNDVVKVYAGVNGVWFDDDAAPSDFELGVHGRASLSEHLSVVGSTWYGLEGSYFLGEVGPRVTVTDVDDTAFSIGLGIQWRASSDPTRRPEELAYDAALGWRPFPNKWKQFVVGARGLYGVESNQLEVRAAGRWEIWSGFAAGGAQ